MFLQNPELWAGLLDLLLQSPELLCVEKLNQCDLQPVPEFFDRYDNVFVGAANGAMDYIAYVDETWTPEDDEDRKRTLETEAFHLESLKAVLEIAEKKGLSVVGQIRDILAEGEEHLRHLKKR